MRLLPALAALSLLAGCPTPGPARPFPEPAPGTGTATETGTGAGRAPDATSAPLDTTGRMTPPNDPSKRPSDNAPGCDADSAHCCSDSGSIVAATCGPTEGGPERGKGGLCERCLKRCLPAEARIATPAGDVAVSALVPGDLVYTLDAAGRRVAAPILRTAAPLVAPGHEILEVTLADGRVARGSPGHPTAAGGRLDALRAGDSLDGSTVIDVRLSTYAGKRTYDLLPAGPTGTYWADGVLLGSTLR